MPCSNGLALHRHQSPPLRGDFFCQAHAIEHPDRYNQAMSQRPDTHTIDPSEFAAVFGPRDAMGHKGTFGSAGIVGGAPGMRGAVVLAARSALKAGCGRVYVAVPQPTEHTSLDLGQPEVMWRDIDGLTGLSAQITAWAVGCGLGQSPESLRCLKSVFQHRCKRPLVIDADALNALARRDVSPTWGEGPVVLTPHPTEAARLLATETAQVQADRLGAARELARQFNAWVVLKGPHSIVSSPTGQCQINPTGNVALATAGTGDVLTGAITSLLAQGFATDVAIAAALWLHGAAADLWVKQMGGPVGMTAGELIDLMRQLRNQPRSL